MSAEATWRRLAAQAGQAPAPLAAALAATAGAATPVAGIAALLGRLLPPLWLEAGPLAAATLTEADAAAVLSDLEAITARNFEPSGLLGTWVGHRGFQMLASHRLAHRLWTGGQPALAMAVRSAAGYLGCDIHPAARIGCGIFLDHGLGLVVGETAVIEDDVSLWHGVTLGSTLMQAGADRHPKIRRGAVLGAGATLLGNIEVGAFAVVAAGSVVLSDVPPRTTVAGHPARPKPRHRHPYGLGETP